MSKPLKKESAGSRLFTTANYTALTLISLFCLLPFLNVFASSFASTEEVISKKFILFPTTFSLDAYRYILSTPTIFKGLGVSIGVTVTGTIISMALTALMAYGLSRQLSIRPQFDQFYHRFLDAFQRRYDSNLPDR